jgi:hypothetical protein
MSAPILEAAAQEIADASSGVRAYTSLPLMADVRDG